MILPLISRSKNEHNRIRAIEYSYHVHLNHTTRNPILPYKAENTYSRNVNIAITSKIGISHPHNSILKYFATRV